MYKGTRQPRRKRLAAYVHMAKPCKLHCSVNNQGVTQSAAADAADAVVPTATSGVSVQALTCVAYMAQLKHGFLQISTSSINAIIFLVLHTIGPLEYLKTTTSMLHGIQ